MIRTRGRTRHHVDVRAVDDLTCPTAPGKVTGALEPDGAAMSAKTGMTPWLFRPTRGTALVDEERFSEPSR